MTSRVQKRIRITGIVLGAIPLTNMTGGILLPLVLAFPALAVPVASFMFFSIVFLPVAIVLGLIDLGMTLASGRSAKKTLFEIQQQANH